MSLTSMNRRTFLEFLGKGIAVSALAPTLIPLTTSYYKDLKGISPSRRR